MENINNMASNSLEALSRDNLSGEGKKRLAREMICGAIALACLAVGYIYSLIKNLLTRLRVKTFIYLKTRCPFRQFCSDTIIVSYINNLNLILSGSCN